MANRTCNATGLTIYNRLDARLEAGDMRNKATDPRDPRREASFEECRQCGGWHVRTPAARRNPPKE